MSGIGVSRGQASVSYQGVSNNCVNAKRLSIFSDSSVRLQSVFANCCSVSGHVQRSNGRKYSFYLCWLFCRSSSAKQSLRYITVHFQAKTKDCGSWFCAPSDTFKQRHKTAVAHFTWHPEEVLAADFWWHNLTYTHLYLYNFICICIYFSCIYIYIFFFNCLFVWEASLAVDFWQAWWDPAVLLQLQEHLDRDKANLASLAIALHWCLFKTKSCSFGNVEHCFWRLPCRRVGVLNFAWAGLPKKGSS